LGFVVCLPYLASDKWSKIGLVVFR
jgi:hypothetical protein